jgi:hypothetical protein
MLFSWYHGVHVVTHLRRIDGRPIKSKASKVAVSCPNHGFEGRRFMYLLPYGSRERKGRRAFDMLLRCSEVGKTW